MSCRLLLVLLVVAAALGGTACVVPRCCVGCVDCLTPIFLAVTPPPSTEDFQVASCEPDVEDAETVSFAMGY